MFPPRTRILLTLLAWGVFLAVAPLVLLYSLGHRVSPAAPKPSAVGAILVRTFPRGAAVRLDGEARAETTPMSIRAVSPGAHAVRIEKAGYRPWEKRLLVEGTKITDVRHVRLIPEEIEEDVVRGNVRAFSVSPKETWLAVAERDARGARVRILPRARPSEPGVVAAARLVETDVPSFLWSPDDGALLLIARQEQDRRFAVMDPNTGETTELRDADDVLGWLPGKTDRLVVRVGRRIEHRAVGRRSRPVVIAPSALAARVFAGGLVVVEPTPDPDVSSRSAIRTYTGMGKEDAALPLPPLTGESVADIEVSPFGDVAILTHPSRRLFLWHSGDRAWRGVSAHAERLQWSPDGEKLLWQTSEFDVWVMNVRERRTVLERFSPELLVRLSVPVRNITWFAGSQHLLFFERDALTIVELDPRDGHRSERLLRTNDEDSAAQVLEDGNVVVVSARRGEIPVLLRIFLRTSEDRNRILGRI